MDEFYGPNACPRVIIVIEEGTASEEVAGEVSRWGNPVCMGHYPSAAQLFRIRPDIICVMVRERVMRFAQSSYRACYPDGVK